MSCFKMNFFGLRKGHLFHSCKEKAQVSLHTAEMADLKLETALETIDQTHSFDLAIK